MLARRRNSLTLGILGLPERSPWPGLLQRIGLAVGIILLVAVFLWFDRDGLRDNAHPERPLRFADVLYFTVVSHDSRLWGHRARHHRGAARECHHPDFESSRRGGESGGSARDRG